MIDFAVAADFHLQPLAQRVHAGDAHAVQSAGNLVAVVVKFAARVQRGQRHLHGRFVLGGMHVHGDAAPVVGHADRAVRVHADHHMVAIAGERLVDAVVNHLVNTVVQTPGGGVADIHGRAQPDRLHAL